jgi:hypothetical protein
MKSALAFCAALLSAAAHALPTPAWVTEQAAPGAMALIEPVRVAPIHVAKEDWPGVTRAAVDLQADFERVSGRKPTFSDAPAAKEQTAIIVGTLGRSPLIDGLVAKGKLHVEQLRGRWEGFSIELVEQPMPGVERALVIAGADKRGTIYGIYELSQQIGVSPWNWWADVPPKHHEQLYVPSGYKQFDAPTVQYRGIFLNDEEPALGGWVREHYGKFDHRFYGKLFELILRLRGNYLGPAMWNPAFFADDPENGPTAEFYGVVIGTSHHEPLTRAHHEWDSNRMGPWDYRRNEAGLKHFWAGGLEQSRGTERVITLGMRGDGDEPMSAANDIPLLERIVADQRALISKEPDAKTAPQVWALYKEVQSYYEQGMRVPGDVTLLWSDDNWGHLRRLPTESERKRSGGAGIYYHLDYVGGPRNYKWLNVTALPKIWEQMRLAAEAGANKMWIVNVGDLKPMEVPTEFFLAMAWRPEDWTAERMDGYLREWATREFGPEHAQEIAEMVAAYAKYNGRRKPELLLPETYSLTSYREAETVVRDWRALSNRAKALEAKLPKEQRDAFFELVLYPIEACAIVGELHYTVALNRLYAKQGRAEANAMAQRARQLFAADAAWTRRYNEELAGGKWRHTMDQTHLGYFYWNEPPLNIMPAVSEVQPRAGAEMGVAVEGSDAVPGAFTLRSVAELAPEDRRIDVFNRGVQPFDFTAKVDLPGVTIQPASGRVEGQQTLTVSVDWAALPGNASQATILINGAGRSQRVVLPLERQSREGLRGFIETGGVIAIEPEHYDRAVTAPGRQWLRIPDHGRTLSGMSNAPMSAVASDTPVMHLAYDVHLFKAGTVKVIATLAPTQNLQPDINGGRGLRYAVSFDDEPPQIVNLNADVSPAAWDRSVEDEAVNQTTAHTLAKPGAHVLKFWAIDPGVVLNKLVIDAGGLQPSYLGPPESVRIRP